jgi:pyruvate ferredoxin oxidoreductase alpha subunit
MVLTGVNRSVGTPVNIQPDHQDTVLFRDTGMIQLYVEDAQEAYDAHVQAFRIAEDRDVLLPVLVCVDGWTISHTFEPVEVEEQEKIDAFLPPYKPLYHLDPKKPYTFGSISIDKDLMEFRYLHEEAIQGAKAKIEAIAREFEKTFGRYYGGLTQSYKTEDADIVFVAMGSIIGTLKEAVDELRAQGKKVGVLKVRSYRPFPVEEIRAALANAKVACVIDRAISIGFGAGPLTIDTQAALYGPNAPQVLPFYAGLGGKDVELKHVAEMVAKAEKAAAGEAVSAEPEYVNINWNLVS